MIRRLLALALLLAAAGARAASPAKPHLVLFVADDYTWSDCAAYGPTDARTPNLERLAREGMRFDRAFAASPTCTPSRSALYTGLYPFRNGAHANHSLVNDGVRTLPAYLKDLGYRVVIAGKTHIGPRPSFPFEFLEGSNVMPEGKSQVLWTDLGTAAVDRLLSAHDRARPLCLVVCSHSPHVYWPETDAYDPAKVTLPPPLLDTPETRAARARYLGDVTWMDRQVGEVLDSLRRHGYAEDTLFAFTADQGAQWPFGKWNLYEDGLRTPLLVRWPGHVKSGATTRAMVSLIDLLPTFIEAAGGKPPKELDGRSLLPLLTGKTERGRSEIFASHTGDGQMNRSPMRCIRTERWKLILNLAPQNPYRTHIDGGNGPDGRVYWDSWVRLSARDPKAAEVLRRYRERPAEELYDLRADPREEHNLAANPKHARTLDDLRARLKKWRLEQGEDLTKVPMPEDARQGDVPYAK